MGYLNSCRTYYSELQEVLRHLGEHKKNDYDLLPGFTCNQVDESVVLWPQWGPPYAPVIQVSDRPSPTVQLVDTLGIHCPYSGYCVCTLILWGHCNSSSSHAKHASQSKKMIKSVCSPSSDNSQPLIFCVFVWQSHILAGDLNSLYTLHICNMLTTY